MATLEKYTPALSSPAFLARVGASIAITMLFGYQLDQHLVSDPEMARWLGAGSLPLTIGMLLIAGTGWGLQMLFSTWVLKHTHHRYLHLLGRVMVVGVALLLPGYLVDGLTGFQHWWIPAIGTLISSLTMLAMHMRLTRKSGMPVQLTFWWFAFLQGGAAAWLAILYF